jgi:Fe-S-cluster containining protein
MTAKGDPDYLPACTACGRCCAGWAIDAPDIGLSDLTEPLVITADGDEFGWVMAMVSEPGDPLGVERCAALTGTLDGACSCVIYEERPAVCREFERDGASCDRARARW